MFIGRLTRSEYYAQMVEYFLGQQSLLRDSMEFDVASFARRWVFFGQKFLERGVG